MSTVKVVVDKGDNVKWLTFNDIPIGTWFVFSPGRKLEESYNVVNFKFNSDHVLVLDLDNDTPVLENGDDWCERYYRVVDVDLTAAIKIPQ
jgi:hypothetical protein